MSYDDFQDKLREIKEEYREIHKKELETIKELETHLVHRKMRFGKHRQLRSLKGFSF